MSSDQRKMIINRVINRIWLDHENPEQIGFQTDFQSLTVNLETFEVILYTFEVIPRLSTVIEHFGNRLCNPNFFIFSTPTLT